MQNLFTQKKAKVTKTAAKKDNKPRVSAATKQEQVQLFQDIQRKAQLKKLIDEYTAEMNVIDSGLKDFGKEKYLELYQENGRHPGSIIIEAEVTEKKVTKTAEVMYLTQDKYIKIGEEDAQNLEEKYPNLSVVEETTEFKVDMAMIQKYGQAISDFIMTSKKIADDDRMKILVPETTYSIKKGAIENLVAEDEDGNTYDIEELYTDIQPIAQLKTPKVV